MLISKEQFDLSGNTCNKIGAGHTAFVHDQGKRCRRPPQSCFDSGQPYHFWKKNKELVEQGLSPVNFLDYHVGKWDLRLSNGSVSLRVDSDEDQFIEFVAPASLALMANEPSLGSLAALLPC